MKTKTLSPKSTGSCTITNDLSVSVGNVDQKPGRGTKTDGIKIRGTGAAKKGKMARGPMA